MFHENSKLISAKIKKLCSKLGATCRQEVKAICATSLVLLMALGSFAWLKNQQHPSVPLSHASLNAGSTPRHPHFSGDPAAAFLVLEALNTVPGFVNNGRFPAAAAAPVGCPKLTVHCLTQAQMNIQTKGHAAAYCDRCDVYLTQAMCDQTGLNDGDQATPGEMDKWKDAYKDSPAHSLRDIGDICEAAHELTHGLDHGTDKNMRHCTTEVNAYNTSASCVKHFQDQFCSGNPNLPSLSAADCAQIAGGIVQVQDDGQLNACLCTNPAPFTADQCVACTNACIANAVTQAQKDNCTAASNLYCNEGHPPGGGPTTVPACTPLPTDSSTPAPTSPPTNAPTPAPTNTPTTAPTSRPT